MKITPDSKMSFDKFKYSDYSNFRWWDYGIKDDYVEELKSVAVYHGYSPDEIDMLISEGFTLEEIEDFIYQAD